MARQEKIRLQALLRSDLASFTQKSFYTVAPGEDLRMNWHVRAIAWRLAQCLDGRIRRLIITLPPRNLKSVCASVAFPAWALGHDPTRKIICGSYSHELSAKLARDCRAVMQSGWYRELFPRTRIDPEKNAELEFMTTRRGFRMATSVGGTLTGRGGDILIIDDPIKPADALSDPLRESVNQWFDNTLYSRLDDKSRGVIILVMHRLHADDLAGHVLGKEEWVHLNLPAVAERAERIPAGEGVFHERAAGDVLHPEREPLEVLERIKAAIGTFAFSAQYQQNPLPPEGNLIRWEWFRRYSSPPRREGNDQVVQSWDTASKAGSANDFSACTTWLVRGTECYLLDVRRERLEYPALKKCIAEHARRHGADAVLIEDMGSGTQLIQDLRHEGDVRPIAIRPEGDKVTRMGVQSAKIEQGHVLLPDEAPWLGEFQREVLQFPRGRHDDQVDSMSQFLGWVRERRARRFRAGGERLSYRTWG